MRNRVMEALHGLVFWEEDVQTMGFGEHFSSYFDFVPDDGGPYYLTTYSQNEYDALSRVQQLMVEAADATPSDMTLEQYRASGWPQRIEPLAREALRMMVARGRFDEEHEEAEPSTPIDWSIGRDV